jgi:predicted phosphodiesterase
MICPKCTSSCVIKEGTRERKKSRVQEFSCKSCNKWFSVPINSDIEEGSGIFLEDIEPGDILEYKTDKSFKLHCATDIHHGAIEHHWEKFEEFVEEVDSDPKARWFMNGDNIELIPPNYKISQRGQAMEPDQQHITFIKRIEKIADKLIFIRGGNHDMTRSINLLGFDVSKVMADILRVPYYRLPGYTRIKVGNQTWYFVSGHGKSGAKNGDLELDKMAAVYSDGDIFFLGHNHQLYAKPVDSLKVENSEERIHRRWYCRGGSFLQYADYARYSFFPIVRTGWVTVEFTDKKIKSWTN